MPSDVRVLAPAELEAALRLLIHVFGQQAHDEDIPVELDTADPARFYGSFDDGALVAAAGSFDLRLTIPGAVIAAAGVTWVGVLPTHRRQGLLTSLVTRQLHDLHAADTAVAALWASEGAIYQRFGYGPASWHLSVTVPSGAVFRRPVAAGSLRLVTPDAAALAPVYDAVAARTPGWFARDDAWWAYRLHDPEHARDGATPQRCVVTTGGYALYSQTSRWADGLPGGVVTVRELVAADEGARERLWRYLLDLDLMTEVSCRLIATDDPLLHLLAEPRAVRARLSEDLWVRLVDVGAALASRAYACDIDAVLEVVDEQCPWNAGQWRLTGGPQGGQCVRTDAATDLVVGVADLGSAFLGGTPLSARRAGIQELTPGSLQRVSTAFGPVGGAPWCPMVF
ncbi:MAG: GNAT family N-acetyltransferase [Frankiales bacterium]|nr:GNAT family N-acetyltransferase [Frankiales bacterium]